MYCYDTEAPNHRPTAAWLDALFKGPEWIGIPWLNMWAFLRISTNPRAMRRPFSPSEALAVARELFAQPKVVSVEPGPRHLDILQRLVTENQISSASMTDAALAALALEQGSILASTDRGFARFKGLRWVNPLG